MTHVFIVNEKTFDIHLQYMFAGTGYGDYEPQLDKTDGAKYEAENTLTGMIADISKIRLNDKVIFYVTGCKKFFGIFQIASLPFFNSKQDNYLGDKLEKYLPFRVKLVPYKVYAKGISEHEALDEIEGISNPYEMCWSLIYRKLTGNRGCSFITDFEYARLKGLIESTNNSNVLLGGSYCYDKDSRQIKAASDNSIYEGKTCDSLEINNRLFKVKGSYEVHLQAYITQNFDSNLKNILLPQNYINFWIGNEVFCSVGEQRIDTLIVSETEDEILIRIIELKDERPTEAEINYQLAWYIKWVNQYIASNYKKLKKRIKIIPTVIAACFNRNSKNKKLFFDAFKNFNNNKPQLKNAVISDLEFISFTFTDESINFKKEIVE